MGDLSQHQPSRLRAIALANVVQLALALMLRWLLALTANTGITTSDLLAVVATCFGCALTGLALLHLASTLGARMHADTAVRLTPPFWGLAVAALTCPSAPELAVWMWTAVPLVGSTWSAAIVATLLAPSPERRPSLQLTVHRGLGWLGTALSTFAVTAVLVVDGGALGVSSLIAAASFVGMGALAWVAGWCIGELYSHDLRALAREVEGVVKGHDSQSRDPIAVTRDDEIGELQQRLERLRKRLWREMVGYRSALEKTRAADARKAEFLDAVSHELRTPLNVVGGFAQLLLEGAGGPLTQTQREDVELIRDGGKHLLELVNDVLDLSMIESGELRLTLTPVDMGQLVHEAIRLHGALVRDKPVQLRVELGPDLPNVTCDRRRIAQVLHNLLGNAIKFTDEGSVTVRVTSDPQAGNVSIRCEDTGSGIDPAELAVVFEEYRQADTVSRSARGTGLGLAIARRLAMAHGGTLAVQSALGEGSVFTLCLPSMPREPGDRVSIGRAPLEPDTPSPPWNQEAVG